MSYIKSLLGQVEYRQIVLLMICVVCVIAVVFICIHFYDKSFKTKRLDDYLYKPIEPNGYFQQQVDDSCVYFAKLLMKYQHGSDLNLFCSKVIRKIKPLFFKQVYTSTYVDIYFSKSFVDFVNQNYSDAYVGDFAKIAKAYLKSVVEWDDDLHVDTDFENSLINNVVTQVMTTQEAQKLQAEMIAQVIDEATEIDSAQKDALTKRLISTSYNCAVRDIKLHDNKGLNPVDLTHLKKNMLAMISDLKVYTHQKLLSLKDDDKSYLDCEGCYIIYNTFTNKYFVGKSDTMFTRVYDLLTNPDAKGCRLLNDDINAGHLVLVKFVRFSDTSYKDVARLQRDLILSYDCRQDKGYNK